MIFNLKIVRVNSDYCDYLRKFDNRVSYNKYEKELRPFIGILFKIDTCEYFAPLSSPKAKHKNNKNEFLEWYFDIAKDSALTEEGVPYIDDLYLDVILTPGGEIKMIDQEELQEALDKKIIMQEDFDLAYKVANNLINQLQGKVDKVIEFTKKYFDILNNSADEIIKLVK